jgi:hypothetical protein
VEFLIVVVYLELQGLKLYGVHYDDVFTQVWYHISKVNWTHRALLHLFISRRRCSAVLGPARVVGGEVCVVGDAVAVPISSPGVRTAAGRGAGDVGAGIIPIANTVAVLVGAASVPRQAWLTRTGVIPIANPIAIAVGATGVLSGARLPRALVLGIGGVVAVRVPRCRTAILFGQARFVGAGVFAVAHAIGIGVGATFDPRRAGFAGAGVGLIEETITIPIPLARHGAAVALRQARLVRAGVFGVGGAVAIPVGAAVGGWRPRLIGAGVGLIGHPSASSMASTLTEAWPRPPLALKALAIRVWVPGEEGCQRASSGKGELPPGRLLVWDSCNWPSTHSSTRVTLPASRAMDWTVTSWPTSTCSPWRGELISTKGLVSGLGHRK